MSFGWWFLCDHQNAEETRCQLDLTANVLIKPTFPRMAWRASVQQKHGAPSACRQSATLFCGMFWPRSYSRGSLRVPSLFTPARTTQLPAAPAMEQTGLRPSARARANTSMWPHSGIMTRWHVVGLLQRNRLGGRPRAEQHCYGTRLTTLPRQTRGGRLLCKTPKALRQQCSREGRVGTRGGGEGGPGETTLWLEP